jgi:nucleoside-diphosphate-sugar epimerase
MGMTCALETGLDVKIARLHNVYGPHGSWRGGREKAPAAICRKVIEAVEGGEIEIWGDGQQTRSFLYIDECIEAIRRLMASSDFTGPVNIGSEEMVTIKQLAEMIIGISGKTLSVRPLSSSSIVGVRGRNSDNRLLRQQLGYEPTMPLRDGLVRTYAWISRCVQEARQEERFVLESPDNGKTVYRRPVCGGPDRCRIV